MIVMNNFCRMNAALQDDSDMDECGIAYKLMPLGSVFCRQLASQVKQYLYTLVQEHAVWNNQQFWEASFYCDLQKGIETLYHDSQTNPENARLTPGHCDDANKEFVFLNNNEKGRTSFSLACGSCVFNILFYSVHVFSFSLSTLVIFSKQNWESFLL